MSEKPITTDGWRMVRLGDIAKERNERAADKAVEVFSITKHHGAVPSLEYFDREVFSRDTSKYKLMKSGDLAYATIHLDEGSLGLMGEDTSGKVSPMYTVFSVDRSQIIPEFLYKLMKLPSNVSRYKRLGEGSIHRRKSVRFKTLRSLQFYIPSVKTQRVILNILGNIDETIERTGDVIVKSEQLRDSLLHELLTQGLPWHHTEWEIVDFGKVAMLRKEYIVPNNDDQQPYVGLEHISSLNGVLLDTGKAGDTRSLKANFLPEDTLYNKLRPNLGKVIRVDFSGVCSTDLLVIFGHTVIDSRFLSWITRSKLFYKHALRGTAGTRMPRTSWKHLASFKVGWPGLEERTKIVSILDNVDGVYKTLQATYKRQQLLMESISRDLLTGPKIIRAKQGK